MGQDANYRARIFMAPTISPPTPRCARNSASWRPPAGAACRSASPRRNIRFPDDPSLVGAPSGHVPKIRDVRLRAGAGFVVVLMGDIRTMPGLPRQPRCGENSRCQRRDRRPLLSVGEGSALTVALARLRATTSPPSALARAPAGIFALIIAAFRLTSLARCAPAMTLTTAGCPSGKRSAASGNLTLKLLHTCWIRRTRSFTSSGAGP